MPGTDSQNVWVKRVLGVEVGQRNAKAPAEPVLGIWQSAKDDADGQLNSLYDTLKQTGIPVLAEVADQIESVLQSYRVGLTTALMDYEQTGGPAKEKARAAALSAVERFQTSLATDAHVTAADTNPFGVPVTVRITLGTALSTLQGQLSAA